MEKNFDPKKVLKHEKYISSQLFNRHLFGGTREEYESGLFEFLELEATVSFDVSRFKTSKLHTPEEMASSPLALSFLIFLIRVCRPRIVLEIGSFIGYSTANIAATLPADSRIYSYEKYEHFFEIAKENIENLGVREQVVLRCGDAIKCLPKDLDEIGDVDFVFLDGNKENYSKYLGLLGPKLKTGGLVVVDDCFFHGDLLNDPALTEKGAGIKQLFLDLANNELWSSCVVPISNGMLLLMKQD
tara:strand:+ start:37 stop:768 length:732 start_codon:yes stop_codon:yes gene_type:complete